MMLFLIMTCVMGLFYLSLVMMVMMNRVAV